MWLSLSWFDILLRFIWLYLLIISHVTKARPLVNSLIRGVNDQRNLYKKSSDTSVQWTNEQIETKATKLPRCTKSDDDLNVLTREKRFVTHITKWNHKNIRWQFRDPFEIFQNRTDYDIARETLARAFSMWSIASKNALKFNEIHPDDLNNTRLDMDIFFAMGYHGDHEPFDGRGGIVAHSGYPPEGKIHFDASELWMINGNVGIDLRYVVLHETGHALGLRHSKHKDAIMHPIYRTKSHEIALSDDDIKGIRYLYPIHDIIIKNVQLVGRSDQLVQDVKKKSVHIDFEEFDI